MGTRLGMDSACLAERFSWIEGVLHTASPWHCSQSEPGPALFLVLAAALGVMLTASQSLPPKDVAMM